LQNLNTAINSEIANAPGNINYKGYNINPTQLALELLNYGVVQPAEAVTTAGFNIGDPQSSNLQKALGLATVGSSIAMPDKAAFYGLGSGAINAAGNWLFGSPQPTDQTFRSGYQFGAATAPLFEGAQALGEAASKAILPVENPYKNILELARAGELKGATQEEMDALVQELKMDATAQGVKLSRADLIRELSSS
jgi:hypothetical protein